MLSPPVEVQARDLGQPVPRAKVPRCVRTRVFVLGCVAGGGVLRDQVWGGGRFGKNRALAQSHTHTHALTCPNNKNSSLRDRNLAARKTTAAAATAAASEPAQSEEEPEAAKAAAKAGGKKKGAAAAPAPAPARPTRSSSRGGGAASAAAASSASASTTKAGGGKKRWVIWVLDGWVGDVTCHNPITDQGI